MKYYTVVLTLFILTLIGHPLFAQDIRINEVLSSNSSLLDDEGNSPDGFELYNFGGTEVNMEGWTISDNFFAPVKWKFPNINFSSGDYLWIWASGRDIAEVYTLKTLIDEGDQFKYMVPSSNLPPTWNNTNFNDDSWQTGSSGFGYGDSDDKTVIPQGSRAVFIRKSFEISDTSLIDQLILHMDYDDAFIAYLNGNEIARGNILGTNPSYNATPLGNHEALMYQGGSPEKFTIDNGKSFLRNGKNVLAIQGHNLSASSSDFTLIPFLSASYTSLNGEGKEPPAILNLSKQLFHTNFKISAQGEGLYLFDSTRTLVDSLYIPPMPRDQSYGYAYPTDSLILLDELTPGSQNSSTGYAGRINTTPVFSHNGGITDRISLSLSGIQEGEVIRYTTDATSPTNSSALYTEPLSIGSNTVIRARIFRDNYIPSEVETRSYFIRTSHQLPLVSLVVEPDDFFDPVTGMYVLGEGYSGDYPYFGSNIWEEREVPINFSLYEKDGEGHFSMNAGVKIFGMYSRANDQRSLAIFARADYGTRNVSYPLFPGLGVNKFEAFVLRNSGNDWMNTMLRDGALTSLMAGSGLDVQAYRPVVTYLNGEYWGFYNMREKINEHFLASHHKLNPDDINILELGGAIVQGDNSDYQSILNYINSTDMSQESSLDYLESKIDIDNYMIYQAAQIYFNNTDWPGNNIKFWKTDMGRWRWILYDTDFGFGIWNENDVSNNTLEFALDPSGPSWPNPSWSTLLFRKLMENTTFNHRFINRFADELNSRFLSERVVTHIDTLASNISDEVPDHYERWSTWVGKWENQVNGMKNFARSRPSYVRQHIQNKYALPAQRNLIIDNNYVNRGYVTVNTLFIKDADWSGIYFEDVPVPVTAIPKTGFKFVKWMGHVNGEDKYKSSIRVNLDKEKRLVPVFESITKVLPLVINEINYHASPDKPSEDWIELYNPNDFDINVSNWMLKDFSDSNAFIIPEGTLIYADSFLVLARNMDAFRRVNPQVKNTCGDFNFGLSSEGDFVRLFDDNNALVDSVVYLPYAPWPSNANGLGYTLELKNPTLDNLVAGNWDTINEYGSPGKENSVQTKLERIERTKEFIIFPNPATSNSDLFIDGISKISAATLFGMNGKAIPLKMRSSNHIELPELQPGIYILRFSESTGLTSTQKISIQK